MNDQCVLEVVLVLTNVTVGFLTYYFVPRSAMVLQAMEDHYGTDRVKVVQWYFRGLCGFFF